MRKLHILSLTAVVLALSACGGRSGTSYQGMDSIHQPVVSRTDFVYDVNDGAGAQGAQRLAGWLETLSVGFGDRISLDDPTGNPSNRTLVSAAASRFGMIVQDTAPVTQGAIAPGSFRVVVSRATATVPGCPDWSRKSVGNYNGDAPSNFGCATNANLAATIANPNDLIGDGHQTSATNSNYFRPTIRKPAAK